MAEITVKPELHSFEPVELPSHYAKALVAIIAAGLTMLVTVLDDGVLTTVEGLHVILAVLTAVTVYLVPNLPEGAGRHLKAAVAIVGAGLQAAIPLLIDGGVTATGWIVIALAVLGAMSVGIVPNTGYFDYQPERALEE